MLAEITHIHMHTCTHARNSVIDSILVHMGRLVHAGQHGLAALVHSEGRHPSIVDIDSTERGGREAQGNTEECPHHGFVSDHKVAAARSSQNLCSTGDASVRA